MGQRSHSGPAEGIFQDHVTPFGIHQRHVEPHFGQQSPGFAGQEFLGGLAQPRHLTGAKPFRRPVEIAAFLDLDKDQGVTVPGDQVDFAALPAPAAPGAVEWCEAQSGGSPALRVVAADAADDDGTGAPPQTKRRKKAKRAS